ncbi:MAG: hypothetical protein GY832_40275 [Chloroflexi bacterium]|nr:hypothetical protein [Chloroflexota bacterium]
MLDKFKKLDPGSLILRLGALVISLLTMLAGLVVRKYALFRDELALYLKYRPAMCYAIGPGEPQPPPIWGILDALPSGTEALVLVVIAGIVGVCVPKKWRVTLPWVKKSATHQPRHQLRERLLDEGRFPDDVAQQLENHGNVE